MAGPTHFYGSGVGCGALSAAEAAQRTLIMQVSTEAELLSQAAGGASSTPPLLATPIAESAPWFQQFASKNGVTEFARLVSDSDLVGFVEGSETPLTLFVPTNEAILAVTHKLPGDQQLLRELVCVHITLGSLSREQLLSTRSITTVGQQTHHVQVHDSGSVQVGTMSLCVSDVPLPENRGTMHVVDCVMCCLRLLQNCRFEQVWNKTIRPSPKIALQGDWKPNDELHAVLVHCDTWTPRFTGLRGNIVPLGSVAPGADHRAARHFQEGVVHYNELLILEKPPEMSKRKRKKDGEDDKPDATPHYRLMFSLYRRDALPAFAVGADEPTTDGKHLTFCMAPADILIRNSFHMLSEAEKESRRNEYKSKQVAPKPRANGGGNGVPRPPNGAPLMIGMAGVEGHPYHEPFDAAAAQTIGSLGGGGDPNRCTPPNVGGGGGGSSSGVMPAGWVPPLTIEALKSHATDSATHERIVKLEGISPGMTGGAMALLPDAPLLTVLSCKTGPHVGGTSVWIQGSRFNTRTRLYVGGTLAPRLTVISEGLVTIVTPPAQPGTATVEVRATNDGLAWSNALHFTFTLDGLADGTSVETTLMQRQISLLQQFVHACCGISSPSEQMVSDLMAPTLNEPQRLFGAVLALILAGSGGNSAKLELGRQDAHGCTLMHYACALRNAPALQLLLNSAVDAQASDAHGHTAMQWARRFGFKEGEALIARATGAPLASTPPHQTVGESGGDAVDGSCAQELPYAGNVTAASGEATLPSMLPMAGGMAGQSLSALSASGGCLSSMALPPSGIPFPSSQPHGSGGATPRSLEHFLEPQASTAPPSTHNAAERSLAGFLTAAAAHVEFHEPQAAPGAADAAPHAVGEILDLDE